MTKSAQFRQGLKANLPNGAVGEPLFTTDTSEIYIGSSGGNINMATSRDLETNKSVLKPINLIKLSTTIINKYIRFSGGVAVIDNLAGSSVTDYIPISNGDTYTISALVGSYGTSVAVLFDANKNALAGIGSGNAWTKETFTINNANAAYMRVNVSMNNQTSQMLVKGSFLPTAFQTNTDMSEPNFRLHPSQIGQKLYFPKKIYGLLNKELKVFRYGMVDDISPDNYLLIDHNSHECSRSYDYPTNVALPSGSGSRGFVLKNPLTKQIIDTSYAVSPDTTLYVTDPSTKSNPASTKNILCVGDSLTAQAYWQNEFGRMLKTTGGTPTGLGFNNYNFIGTNKENENNPNPDARNIYYSEGRSGWTWEDYTYAPNDPVHGLPSVTINPFWNSSTSKLDFQRYMSVNSFSGNIDYCIILLGWNDYLALSRSVATITATAKLFILALHTDYPNCKVLLCGLNTISPYAKGGWNGFGRHIYSTFAFQLSQAYEQEIASNATYSSYVTYVPITPCFDAEYGMPFETFVANSRTTETIRVATDNANLNTNSVHPNVSGYNQIADTVLATFLSII